MRVLTSLSPIYAMMMARLNSNVTFTYSETFGTTFGPADWGRVICKSWNGTCVRVNFCPWDPHLLDCDFPSCVFVALHWFFQIAHVSRSMGMDGSTNYPRLEPKLMRRLPSQYTHLSRTKAISHCIIAKCNTNSSLQGST
jgi:hypothetical protein